MKIFLFFSFCSFSLPVITISIGHKPENDNICMHHACLKVLEPESSKARGVRLGWSHNLCKILISLTSFRTLAQESIPPLLTLTFIAGSN